MDRRFRIDAKNIGWLPLLWIGFASNLCAQIHLNPSTGLPSGSQNVPLSTPPQSIPPQSILPPIVSPPATSPLQLGQREPTLRPKDSTRPAEAPRAAENPRLPETRFPENRPPENRGTVRAIMASRQLANGNATNSQQDMIKDSIPDNTTNTNDGTAKEGIAKPNVAPAAPTQTVTAPQQPPASNGGSTPDAIAISPETIQAQLQQIQTANDLDATIKQSLTMLYEAILAETKKRFEEEKAIRDFAAAIESAPTATTEAKRRKEQPSFKAPFEEGTLPWSRVDTLKALQLETSSKLQAATKGRTDTETTIASRDARKKEMARYITEDKAIIAKLAEELTAPVPEGIDPRVREATHLLARAKLASANSHLRRLEIEQRTFDAESELLPLRKELFQAEEKFYQYKIKEISEELGKRRENQIEKQNRLALQLLAKSRPPLESQAKAIVKKTDDWLMLAKDHARYKSTVDEAKAEQKQWADRYKIMTDRLSRDKSSANTLDRTMTVSRLKSLVGEMLRRQRDDLPKIDDLNHLLEDYQSRLQNIESLILSLDDWKAKNTASDDPTQPTIDISGTIEEYPTQSVEQQRTVLTAAELQISDEYRLDASNFSETLFNLADLNQQLIDQVRKYNDFIDEHILWIRSSDPFTVDDAKNSWTSAKEFLDLKLWTAIPQVLLSDIRKHLVGYGLVLASLASLMLYTKPMRKQIHALGILAAKSNTISFLPTAKVVLLCILLSAPLVLVHLLLGWRLMNQAGTNKFIESVGMGLLVGARYFLPLEMLRQIARTGGLAENHFQWSHHSTSVLRKHLRWFIDLAVPAVSLVGILWHYSEPKWENTLGRVAFCLLMFMCSLVIFQVIHPKSGVFRDYLQRNAGGWIDRLSYLWYFGLSLSPIVLILMSLMGYHYTAIRLSMHVHTSCMTLIGLLLFYCLICRWLLLSRRQLIVSQARQRLEEARRRDADAPPIATASASVAIENEADLSHINAQTIRLVSSTLIFAACAAIAWIWSSVLPAVGVLDSIHLWTVTGTTPDEKLPVTLANVLLAIPAAIMTVVAAKNLPGLLEIALLQHLPLENAVRYAITSISRYTILTLGIAMTFNSLGVRWASIQWLVAALGVGLGFGLQEIFANFVSGLILLFEQPVRVGDVITVGDTTGTVSRIRMRATTVMNFDQQELVIPNKDLVTGRLLNWTLSDSTNRMIIEVGVAYGTDTSKACRILREICCSHTNVLKEPEPTAFFELFADSTLQLKVRLFLASLDLRLPTRHDILTEIHRRFAEENIEISFPQRDLHIRSLPKDFAVNLGR